MIPFIDLAAQQTRLREDIDRRLRKVMDHGQYILGPEVDELEQKLASFAGTAHCISCGNGTDALQIALMAAGVGPGDEVITPSFSFIATAETVAILGARPVFADVDPATFVLTAAAIEPLISERTRAIIPVSLYGQCPEMEAICDLAKQRGLIVIEDAAQSFGASRNGRKSCALSDIGCTSFFPSKPLGCYGDGGAIFTDDQALAVALRQIARHGQTKRYHHVRIGINSRLDTIQAAILLAKLAIFESELNARDQVAARYGVLLADAGVDLPSLLPGNRSAWAQYTIQVEDREALAETLKAAGVPTAVHYPLPLHRQPAIEGEADCRVSDRLAERVISLPMHPYLEAETQVRIADAVNKALGEISQI